MDGRLLAISSREIILSNRSSNNFSSIQNNYTPFLMKLQPYNTFRIYPLPPPPPVCYNNPHERNNRHNSEDSPESLSLSLSLSLFLMEEKNLPIFLYTFFQGKGLSAGQTRLPAGQTSLPAGLACGLTRLPAGLACGLTYGLTCGLTRLPQ
jgi:hypothetical protein